MYLPLVEMTINAQNGASFTKTIPQHRVACYRAIWDKRLKDGDDGCRVVALPPETPEAMRYVQCASYEEEWNVCAALCGDDNMEKIFGGFDRFKKIVENEIAADGKRAMEYAKARAAYDATVPRPDFLALGLSEAAAVRLHRQGINSTAHIPTEIADLCTMADIMPGQAMAVITALGKTPSVPNAPVEPTVSASPVAEPKPRSKGKEKNKSVNIEEPVADVNFE